MSRRHARRCTQRRSSAPTQEVGRLRALVDQAQFQLTKFSIVAPIAGTILTRGVEPGQVVDLSTSLFTLADLSELVVETDVDESYATQIRTGMPAVLQLTGETDVGRHCQLRVAPCRRRRTGGLAVKIAFDRAASSTDRPDRDGQHHRRSARGGDIGAARRLVTAGDGTAVFVLADGKAQARRRSA